MTRYGITLFLSVFTFCASLHAAALSPKLLAYLDKPEAQIDIAEAALLISKEEYPQMSIQPFLATIDGMAERLKPKLLAAGTPTQRLDALAQFLFATENFQLPKKDDASAFLLAPVLKNKRGNCLGLSVLCLALAERTGLKIYGVPVPSRRSGAGHLLVRFDDGKHRINFDPTEGGKQHSDAFYLKLFHLKKVDTKDGYILSNATKRQVLNLLLVNLGGARVEAGAPELAIPLLEKATKLKSDYAPTYNNLGAAKLERGDHAGAKAAYTRAKQLDPESVGPRLGLAQVALLENDPEAAERELQLVLAVEPNNKEAQSIEANLYIAKGNAQSAVNILQRIADQNPKDVSALNNLALAQRTSGLFPQAEATYRKGLKIDKNNVEAIYGLGETLRAVGKAKEAQQQFKLALRIDPHHAPTHLAFAQIAKAQNDFVSAQKHFEAILREQPTHLEALAECSQMLLAQKKVKDANVLLFRAQKHHPDHPGIQMLVGDARMQAGDTRGALEVFNIILNKGPKRFHVPAKQRIAACYGKLRNHKKAFELAEELLKAAPNDLNALRVAAAACEGMRNARLALTYYRKILAQSPSDTHARSAIRRLRGRR